MKNYGVSKEGHFDWNNRGEGNVSEGSMNQKGYCSELLFISCIIYFDV